MDILLALVFLFNGRKKKFSFLDIYFLFVRIVFLRKNSSHNKLYNLKQNFLPLNRLHFVASLFYACLLLSLYVHKKKRKKNELLRHRFLHRKNIYLDPRLFSRSAYITLSFFTSFSH